MYTVKNTSDSTQSFWGFDEQGTSTLFHVEPGEEVTARIDPLQAKFGEGGSFAVSKVEPKPQAKPKTAPKAKAAPKSKAAAKTAPTTAPTDPVVQPQG